MQKFAILAAVGLSFVAGFGLCLWLFDVEVNDIAALPIERQAVQTTRPLVVEIGGISVSLPAGTPLLEEQFSPEGVASLALRFRYIPTTTDSTGALRNVDTAVHGVARVP